MENPPHSSSENDVGFQNVAFTLGRSTLTQFLCYLSSESDVSASAFRGRFAVLYDRNVAFPVGRVAFRLSEAAGV